MTKRTGFKIFIGWNIFLGAIQVVNAQSLTVDRVLFDRFSAPAYNAISYKSATQNITRLFFQKGFVYSDGSSDSFGAGSNFVSSPVMANVQTVGNQVTAQFLPDPNAAYFSSFDDWDSGRRSVQLGFQLESMSISGPIGGSTGQLAGVVRLVRDETADVDSRHATAPVGSRLTLTATVRLYSGAVFSSDMYTRDFGMGLDGYIDTAHVIPEPTSIFLTLAGITFLRLRRRR